MIHRPARTTVRIENLLASRAPTADATNMVIETGSILMPVSRASRPEDQLQVERHGEEHAHEDEVLAEQPDQPGAQRRDLQQAEVHERVAAGRLAVALPGDERPEQHGADRDHEQGQGEAERLDGRVLGLDPAPGARLQHAEDDQAETGRRQHRADDVEAGLGSGTRGVADQARHREDEQHEDDLADEDDPPGQLGGRPAAQDRADGDAGAGDAADDGVGDVAVLALVVAGDQGDQGGHDERRADALEDRPAEGEDGHRLGHGGERGAASRR